MIENSTSVKKVISKKLKLMRVNLGLTQKEFAQKLGTTQFQISAWETGKWIVSTEYLYKICEVFGMRLEYFDSNKPTLFI